MWLVYRCVSCNRASAFPAEKGEYAHGHVIDPAKPRDQNANSNPLKGLDMLEYCRGGFTELGSTVRDDPDDRRGFRPENLPGGCATHPRR